MRSWILVAAVVLAGCTAPAAPPTDPPSVVSQVDPEKTLAGLEFPVVPDAGRALRDLETYVEVAPRRYDNQFEHEAARTWLETEFGRLGLQVERQRFTGPSQANPTVAVEGQNILATLPGRDPSRVIVFGAHYDGAVSGFGAAYDDGSGTLIVLELARALSTYTFNHTLVFAEWDQEEAGLVGSEAYVASLLEADDREVTINYNFDMTGINWPAKLGGIQDTPLVASFGGDSENRSVELWRAVTDALGYPAGSTTTSTGLTAGSSDHGSFRQADMPAAWIHGGLIASYPMYHNADRVETMIADVGGDRADLEAGFDTALQTVFRHVFLVDAEPS